MAYFVVNFVGPDGSIQKKPVEAITREEAISKSGLSSRTVQSVEVDHLGAFRAAFVEKRLPMTEQILSLVTISAKLEAGKTPSKAILESINIEELGISSAEFYNCERAADFFKLLRFDETAILLADAGDKAGNLAESLKRAADVLRERMKAKKEFAKPMRTAVINFVVGIAAVIGFPLFGGSMLHEYLYVQKFPITPSAMSHILMFLRNSYLTYWPAMLAVLVALFFFRGAVWEFVRDWPVFKLFDERQRSKRGLELVQAYMLMSMSGFTTPQILKFIQERSSGMTRALYDDAIQRNSEGRPLGEVFANQEWPVMIAQNFNGFEQQSIDSRTNILGNLSVALSERFLQFSEKIAGAMSKGAMIVLIGSILLFALGFYVPMMTMRVQM